jgi:tRNA 2-thiouridine synthesizing protein A
MTGNDVITVDARGLRCPWPAIRLARVLRGSAGVVEIIADDPAAEREIRALASAQGREIDPFCVDGCPAFRIR